jgi:hypothetical protein
MIKEIELRNLMKTAVLAVEKGISNCWKTNQFSGNKEKLGNRDEGEKHAT